MYTHPREGPVPGGAFRYFGAVLTFRYESVNKRPVRRQAFRYLYRFADFLIQALP